MIRVDSSSLEDTTQFYRTAYINLRHLGISKRRLGGENGLRSWEITVRALSIFPKLPHRTPSLRRISPPYNLHLYNPFLLPGTLFNITNCNNIAFSSEAIPKRTFGPLCAARPRRTPIATTKRKLPVTCRRIVVSSHTTNTHNGPISIPQCL
ncbi:uncharacterized protein BDZ99DRAFT_155145 [Mytilinidion resinicola]|uniref:Uncharacterized protein n=1 Tax=Mytilinidion resinicola TaxID=574789 RepID=A0A6A6Y8N2_9PEZI|nr:uncharacterized protein BDZ99DRAFT_155145 [Mytilinidion resinicola]KAF2804324.1 hypothetical protein BDZ99DRAFT_155145 [Mytilinidion resinicola]